MNKASEIDILKITMILLGKKKTLFFSIVLGFCIMAALSFIIPPTFSSSVTLAPSEKLTSNTSNNFSALGSIVGLGNAGSGDKLTTYYGIIESKEIARQFIRKNNLKPMLFEKKWDKNKMSWLKQEEPSLLEATTYFKDKVLRVSKDNLTGFVTISIRHHDPLIAKQWSAQFTKFVNLKLASRQKTLSENNISYLKKQLQTSEIIILNQHVTQLLTKELSTLMLVNTNAEYAYQIIDSAVVPEIPIAPKKRVYALLGALIGFLIGSVYILYTSKNA